MGAAIRLALCVDGLADRVVYVSDLDCVAGCRKLAREEAILAGASSGGVVAAMEMLSLDMPKNSICVGILPDRGERYLDQVYSDDWVKEYFGEVGLLRAAACPLPRKWRCFRPEPSSSEGVQLTLPEPVNRATGKTMLQDTSGFLSILCADEIKATRWRTRFRH